MTLPLVSFASDRYPLALGEAEVRPPLAFAAVLIGAAALLISFVVGLSFGLGRAKQAELPEVGPIEGLPSEDLPRDDVADLRRYPGAVRVKYESHLLGDARVTEAGYLAEGRMFDVSRFYRQRLGEAGWSFEGEDFDGGELSLRVLRGKEELLVELEDHGELVEVEVELSEPISP